MLHFSKCLSEPAVQYPSKTSMLFYCNIIFPSADYGNKLSLLFLISTIAVLQNIVFIKQLMRVLLAAVIFCCNHWWHLNNLITIVNMETTLSWLQGRALVECVWQT